MQTPRSARRFVTGGPQPTGVGGRVGIFGGTFDPPHTGHLLVALDALDALALDTLLLVPAAQQPLKVGQEMSLADHRLAMTRCLAVADPRLRVDASEVTRGGLSYSVDTVRALHAANPDATLSLIVGADAAARLGEWRDPAALAALVELVIAGRGAEEVAVPSGFRVARLPVRRVDISATEIRARVRAGRSIRGFVPDAVAAYIEEHRLYRTTTE